MEWRVNGPYKHGRRWRVQFARGSGRERETRYETFATRAAAEACLDAARDEAQGTTVRDAVEKFLAHRRAAGLSEHSLATYEDRLNVLLGPVMSRPLRSVRTRGNELYLASTEGRRPATHHNGLLVGHVWARWCVKRGLLKADPFVDVETIGVKAVGADKARLTVNESRTLYAWCLKHRTEPGAVLVLSFLVHGMRASELVGCTVRDLDDDGFILRVRGTKSLASRRALSNPQDLRDALVDLAAGRAPDAPLFATDDGAAWTRHTALHRVKAACAAAGVSVVSPHGLRRTQATLATDAGEVGLAVARHLGHSTGEAPVVTHRAYIGRESATAAKTERALRVIQGGRR